MKQVESEGGKSGGGALVGQTLAGRYRVARVLSAGANTVLADAIDVQTDGQVTVKIVRSELAADPEFRRKFRHLAEISNALTHPNIASVSDWGEIELNGESTVFWTVDALGGGSLRDLLDRGRLLEPGQALVVGLEACRALDAAHQKGLFHTELTPSKMVFGADRRLRVVDFGMARLLAEPAWVDASAVPTHVARYASPEQALGLPIDATTDVYALALVMIEAVTGVVPFAADSTVATLAGRVDRLLPVSADLGSLASVLERAGRPDAGERFSAAEFGRALVQAAPKLPKPEPIPVLSTGQFDTTAMRRPTDPTGGVDRPAPAPGLAGVGETGATAAAGAHTAQAVKAVGDDIELPADVTDAAESIDGDAVESDLAAAPVAEPHNDVETETAAIETTAIDTPVTEDLAEDDLAEVDGTEDGVVVTAVADRDPVPEHPDDTAHGTPVDEVEGDEAEQDEPEVAAAALVESEGASDDLKIIDEATTVVPVAETAAPVASNAPEVFDDAPDKRRKGPVILLVLLLLAGLGALGYAGSLLLQPKSFEVPVLAGVPDDEALNQIAGNEWEISVERERSDSFPALDTVIRTVPGPGVELEEGEAFTLVLSDGAEFRTLPDLNGLAFDAAVTQLASLGLVGIEGPQREFSETQAIDSIISWQVQGDVDASMQAGAQILPGETVVMTLSMGPEPRVVPDVAGQTLDAATRTFEALRLGISQGDELFSETVPAGAIVTQDPAPEASVERDAIVTVQLSKGPDRIEFPDLAGLSFTEAQDLLLETGFTIGSLLGSTDGSFVEATIDGEDVAVATLFRRGQAIDLIFL
ncbi:MAG: PASTA domain-containing protein [Ilumatobacter sp.]